MMLTKQDNGQAVPCLTINDNNYEYRGTLYLAIWDR